MFRKGASQCKLPVSVDAKPLNLASVLPPPSPEHIGHPDKTREAVRAAYSSKAFGGSAIAGLFSALAVALFGLTYGYHIGKPVYDAYTKKENDNDDDDESD